VLLKKEQKKSVRRLLVKKTDTAMSKYIRARDGYVCVTCGSRDRLQNGHLFSRNAYSTRWLELNCHCQCSSCNMTHEYNPHIYTNWFIHKYGVEKYDELLFRHNQVVKYKDGDLIALEQYFTDKLNNLPSII
jgi:hypothetical protein